MRARSAWLSHAKFKATWVAIAAGSLAGLAVLGACSDAPVSRVAGPSVKVTDPRFGTVVGGNAHVVKVCSDLNSTGGPVTVNVSFQGGKLELNAVDADNINTYQYNFGPYTSPDVITATVTISPNECKTVFQRNNTCAAGADCSDPLQHLGNRMWTNESNTSNPPPGGSGTPPQGAVSVPWPNIPQVFNGIVNPRAGVFITAVIPNGYTMDNLVCTNDDVLLPQSCVNGGYSSANVFHGSVFTYTFTSHETGPCILPNSVFGLGAANGFTLLGLEGNVIDIGTGGTLIRGDVGFGPTNSGVVKKASVLGNLTNDPTSTVNIFADFNVSGTTTVASLAAASAAATAASANLDALAADQAFGALTANTTFTNPGGTEVFDIASVNMTGKTITIVGDADDVFIFNVAGRFNFRSSQMILSGGVRPSNIIWNFTGTLGEVIVKDPSTRAFGVFLAPDRSFNGDKSVIVGAVMGGLSILIHSNGQLLCEESVI